MERLIYSSSPSKLIDLKHNSILLPLPQKFRLSSSPTHFPKRVKLVCRNRELPSSILTASALSSDVLTIRAADCVDGSAEKPVPGVQIENGALLSRKIGAILLSALVAVFIPILVPPAFATLQTSANGGGSVAAVGRGLASAEFLSSAWTGFLAGCLHTLSGPDHLAALAPLSIGRTTLQSAAVGALWGAGHDAGQVIFGLLFLLLKDRLQIEILQTWGTRVVGLTLMVIGAIGIKEAYEIPASDLETGDAGLITSNSLDYSPAGKKKIGFATFATGVVHGLQPDALMIVLPALALPSRLAGAAFLGMFLLGTVFSMGSYTAFLGSCSQALKERIPRITEKLTWASSLLALALGLAIIISQFFGFNLY